MVKLAAAAKMGNNREIQTVFQIFVTTVSSYAKPKYVIDILDSIYNMPKKMAKKEFGGYDGVVLWHAYPRIGIDERNQFDFYRDMPGGLEGLKDVVDRFHKLGVKVFINYNPWDTGTRKDGKSDIDALVDILKATNADGIFLDTLNELEDY